nr:MULTISPECIES: glucans biosynthesis glucosyltransferase MdoH [unclassified Herbaspirillum]
MRSVDDAAQQLARYLDHLPLSAQERAQLLAVAGQPKVDAPHQFTERMTSLHDAIARRAIAAGRAQEADPAAASVAGRLEFCFPGAAEQAVTGNALGEAAGPVQGDHLKVAPPLQRRSMVPRPWGTLNPLSRWVEEATRRFEQRAARRRGIRPKEPQFVEDSLQSDAPDPLGYWQHSGNVRRLVLLVLMLLQTVMATYFMSDVLPYHGTKPLEMLVLGLFAILFCWVSAGFWTAMTGFLVLLRGDDPYLISHEAAGPKWISPEARTAIVMPICNEDVARVFAGLRATYESVKRHGDLDRFDFFVLSDSGDADICVAEVQAWAQLCKEVDGFGRIFYRHRRRRVKRKSGNIDDFCRRWGAKYRYMLVLDADSVMSGQCLSTLVRLMEAHPGAGIIQTAPRAAGRDTLYARIQQFSTRVYGPLFTAGLHFWQLGESHYWGHNAIIRLAPFMQHCALAPLPGEGNLSGPILSHDFVEASLMRRAGWSVWIAYDLDGSYEEMPPNLLDELSRDRRWCQGNLMNFRLFLARGMHAVHRAVFVTGVMAYLSAPLWALFLALSTLLLASHTLIDPQYFVTPRQLFPIWPEWHPEKALALVSATASILFLPKILSVFLIIVKGARDYGGALKLSVSMLIELLFSMMLAPVRMLFHTRFVLGAFLGWAVGWKSPPRADNETGWDQAFRRHGWHTVLGLSWGALVYWLDPSFVWWLLPIAGSLTLSIPLSVLSSRVSLGRGLRQRGLFTIPEEVDAPRELRDTVTYVNAASDGRALPDFVDAVVDPAVNALVCAVGHAHARQPEQSLHAGNALVLQALRRGPEVLTAKQKHMLLDDPRLLSALHLAVWSQPVRHSMWMAKVRQTV